MLIYVDLVLGCGAGQYWAAGDLAEADIGSGGVAGECVSCGVGRYQDFVLHHETECKNCSGTEIISEH